MVVERLDIKKSVYEKIEQFRKPGTLVSSNTSGIPINMLVEGRSDDFKNILQERFLTRKIFTAFRNYSYQ